MKPGDVISYLDMCQQERVNLQRGMNFHWRSGYSVILMSVRQGAPYADRIEENGKILIYEGHDVPKTEVNVNPKSADQLMTTPLGTPTQNGLFYQAAQDFKANSKSPEKVKVYEKIRAGIWVYNGYFNLIDAWQEVSGGRKVFKFKLELSSDFKIEQSQEIEISQTRMIPSQVKMEVWKRDKGQCRICGSKENLHFDHIIPYSLGGSSLVADNIQLLCAKHNLAKKDKIQ
jgi:hypothetical protein